MNHVISTIDENAVKERTSHREGLLNFNIIINIFPKDIHNYFLKPKILDQSDLSQTE